MHNYIPFNGITHKICFLAWWISKRYYDFPFSCISWENKMRPLVASTSSITHHNWTTPINKSRENLSTKNWQYINSGNIWEETLYCSRVDKVILCCFFLLTIWVIPFYFERNLYAFMIRSFWLYLYSTTVFISDNEIKCW